MDLSPKYHFFDLFAGKANASLEWILNPQLMPMYIVRLVDNWPSTANKDKTRLHMCHV